MSKQLYVTAVSCGIVPVLYDNSCTNWQTEVNSQETVQQEWQWLEKLHLVFKKVAWQRDSIGSSGHSSPNHGTTTTTHKNVINTQFQKPSQAFNWCHFWDPDHKLCNCSYTSIQLVILQQRHAKKGAVAKKSQARPQKRDNCEAVWRTQQS